MSYKKQTTISQRLSELINQQDDTMKKQNIYITTTPSFTLSVFAFVADLEENSLRCGHFEDILSQYHQQQKEIW